MNALVTGGGGFLGEAIVRQLVARGETVCSFSRNTYPALRSLGVEQRTGDLVDADAVNKAVADCDTVFHVGAKAGAWGSYSDYFQANVVGTQNVIHACRKNKITRLIYTSSPSVVFNGLDMKGVDESVPYASHFEAPYPETKAIAEKAVREANSPELATVALRPHLIFGPGDPHIEPRIVAKAKAGKLRLIGNGENKIDIVYVDNAAKAHLLAADKLEPGSAIAGKVYFISNGDPRSIKEIFDMIMEIHGLPPVSRRVPPGLAGFGGWVFEKTYNVLGIKQEPLVTRFLAKELSTSHWFDISAARKDLGYTPEVSIEEGFNRISKAMRSG
ncbi:MAG: NAD-dependent epimerase/dehydratase family protein [Myxococcota bacterium]|nr:NAD-dependent epimerase/dehydratase family protein [Myxococcota bacterium]